MIERTLYWTTVFSSLLALLLLIGNTVLLSGNRAIQDQLVQRQTLINEANTLAPLNKELAQALAEVAVKNNNAEVRALLATQGITLTKPAEQPVKTK